MVDSRGRSGRSGGQPPGLGYEEISADKRNQPNDDEKSKAHVARPPERNLGLPHCGNLGIPERSSRTANGRESITGTYRRKRVLARLIAAGVRRATNTARITRKIYRKHANTSLTWFSVLSNIRLVLLGVRGNGKALAMARSDFFSIRQARSAGSKALQA